MGQTFAEENAEVMGWVFGNMATNQFAASLAAGFIKYGSLTPKQMAAVQGAMAAKPAAATVSVAGAGFVGLGAALLKAKASGLKYPAIIFDTVCFKLAKEGGKNSGSIYVTSGKAYGSTYYGKISESGAFQASRECGAETKAAITAICADPLGSIVAHGKKTGNCACCNRQLTDPESVERGIGPICYERFFGG